jgi:hypothetical protein
MRIIFSNLIKPVLEPKYCQRNDLSSFKLCLKVLSSSLVNTTVFIVDGSLRGISSDILTIDSSKLTDCLKYLYIYSKIND